MTDDDALWTHNCHWTGLDCVSEVIKVTSPATDPLLGRSHAYIIDDMFIIASVQQLVHRYA